MIVVFDSGIYISALQFGGIPRQALVNAVASDYLIYCSKIEDEVVTTMTRKFGHSAAHVISELANFAEEAILVPLIGGLSGICRDPNDDFILECAVTGHADLIVTGDKDLLSLESYEAVRIVTPRQYLDLNRCDTLDQEQAK
jgi:putative PIN family toxin of toxin-antitoxin system